MQSLATVLIQEIDRFNNLIRIIFKSLENLNKAIDGIMVMSQELDSMYTSLLNNKVPEMWQKVAYPSLKNLASWIKDLKERVAFLRDWT